MRITFNGRKLEITDSLKAYTMKKLSKLNRFFPNDAEASVIFSTERGRFTAEVTVRYSNLLFRAQKTTGDIYAAIDEVEDMIERQIRKNKTRLERRLRDGAFERDLPELDPAAYDDAEDIYDIVRVKRFPIKPMDIDEAVLQMNMLGHQFYAFKNLGDDDRFCVVYRRQGGGYGLIESE